MSDKERIYKEHELEGHWAADLWPDCCDQRMHPTADEVEIVEGEKVWSMGWVCKKCKLVRDVQSPVVWAAAFAMETNPVFQTLGYVCGMPSIWDKLKK